jgi:hypothetical protein
VSRHVKKFDGRMYVFHLYCLDRCCVWWYILHMKLFIALFLFQALRPLQYTDPLNRLPTDYQDYIATSERGTFTYRIVKPPMVSRGGLVAIVVNDSLYAEIEGSINQYVQDLIGEGYSTKVITAMGGTPDDVRNLLKAEIPNNLVGALLVGDLPIAWWEESSYGEDYPIDFFFADLDGSWFDSNSNGLFDQHSAGSGNAYPDIWVGRLYATRLTYDNEARLIIDYFDRNHQYRTGGLTLPNKGLVYNEVIWYPNDHGMGYLYNDVTVVNDENTTTAYDYKNRMKQQFQSIHLLAHSSCWAHTFFLQNEQPGGGSVFSFEIPFLEPDGFFYFLNSCMAGRYTETNNLANWYLFSRAYSQVVIASSSLMYGINSLSGFYQALSNDSTFGDAFKKWHRQNYDWFMGTLVLGDPSLTILNYPDSQVRKRMVDYSKSVSFDWTAYQVENSLFVNGHPAVGNAQGKLWILWDSGRIVRSDTYGSFFSGSGFSDPESVGWHEYYDFFPAVTVDKTGRLWVAWQSFRDYNQYYDHFNIYSCYYYNGSWSSPQYVKPLGGWHDVQPALASGNDDKVWVAFKSFRNGNADIYVSNETSASGWINSYALTQTPEDETDPAVAVDRDNNVWVFWSSSTDGYYHIYGRKYDGNWQAIFAVDTSKTDNTCVQAAVDSLNRVWLVWHQWTGSGSDIYYAYCDGNDWLTPEPVTSNSEDDIVPSITMDRFGHPWLCWMSNRDGDWNIYSSYYDSGWSVPQQVTADVGSDINPSVLSDSSGIWIAWTSDRNNYWNIYAAFTDVSSIKEDEKSPAVSTQVRHAPNPFRESIRFTSEVPFEACLYSVTGRLVGTYGAGGGACLWKPVGLSQGVYFLRIRTNSSEQYSKLIHIK